MFTPAKRSVRGTCDLIANLDRTGSEGARHDFWCAEDSPELADHGAFNLAGGDGLDRARAVAVLRSFRADVVRIPFPALHAERRTHRTVAVLSTSVLTTTLSQSGRHKMFVALRSCGLKTPRSSTSLWTGVSRSGEDCWRVSGQPVDTPTETKHGSGGRGSRTARRIG